MALILDRYTLDYRSEIVEPLLATVAHGSSLCVVGLAGAGKSNLAKFIAQPPVLRHYLPESIAQEMHLVTVQCRPGTQPSAHFYRTLLNELQVVARKVGYPLRIPKEDVTAYDVREAIKHFCETARQRIVIVLDEFECLIQHQPLEFFEELRNLRDEVRTTNRFAYVALTHRLPHRVVGNQRFENSKLYELLREQMYALGPYQPADAAAMLQTLAAREELTIDPGHLDRIRVAAGGHSGIMYAIFQAIKPNFAMPSPRLAALAAEEGLVRQTCDKLWLHLHGSERAALCSLAAGSLPEPWLLEFLYKRGLITSIQTPYLFAPAFAVYINSKCS
jgi:hypothetical protein